MTKTRAILLAGAAALALHAPALAQTAISKLPAASTVAGTDVVPISQSCTGSPPTATCAATNGATGAQLGAWAVTSVGAAVTGAVKASGGGALTQAAAADLSNGTTGSGAVVLATSPTLTTPTLGVAKVTTLAGQSAVTSITAGGSTVVGTGGTVACNTGHVCDSLSGEVLLTTGTSPSATGTAFTVNFANTRTNSPNCVVTETGAAGGLLPTKYSWSVTTSTLAFSATAALPASSALVIDYICGGN